MKQRIGRIAVAGMAAASMAGLGTLALAGPANATDSKCATSQKEYPTNGYNADIKVELCISRNWGGSGGSNSYTWAWAKVTWGDSGAGKFENFDVQVRIEQNDADIKTRTCDFTSAVNGSTSGSKTCRLPSSGSYVNISGNTADGHVVANVNDDGEGNHTWGLQGTGKI
ncbi:hypothetical protein [Actinomadura bangladeshensis]|uniref:Secreted protein n=1 Tax=Actinomadura bangladeshensis TaxID=453573 RepID=A0A6L9QD13_9ACTN|nr:hypothetical protein [Actinomadura bangladeshensis]NEA23387.1 hypothetical protein [Actinomadura bangladeshensis]